MNLTGPMETNEIPRVSVVIPTYNREQWISKAIESVLAQTYTDLEIIVVDDGSTDQSRKMIEHFGGRVRYLFQTNAGVSTARNRGILESRGEWIAFLDSDDEWSPEKLQTQMDLVDRNPQLIMVASDVHIDDGVNKLRLFDIREQLCEDEAERVIHNPLLIVCKMVFFPSSLLVKKIALMQAGMFDETLTYSEDRDLACRVALLGPLGVLAKPLASILSRGDVTLSASQENDPRKAYRSSITAYEKLLGSDRLTEGEKSFVQRCLSGDRFSCGMEEFRRGNRKAGLSLMWRSCSDCRSIRSVVRVLLFFLIGRSGLMQVQRLKRRKGYKRLQAAIGSTSTATHKIPDDQRQCPI